MKMKTTLGRCVLRMLLVAFVVGSATCVFARKFASETMGIPPGFSPELLYESDVGGLSTHIVFLIEIIDASEAKLKANEVLSRNICLLAKGKHYSIKEGMDKLLALLNEGSPETKQKYAEMLHVLEAAIQADSAFEEEAEDEDPAKRDVEYWKKRIASIESILRPCSEFKFKPLPADEKPQPEIEERPSSNKAEGRADRNLGVLWYAVPAIVIVAGIAVVLRLRRRS